MGKFEEFVGIIEDKVVKEGEVEKDRKFCDLKSTIKTIAIDIRLLSWMLKKSEKLLYNWWQWQGTIDQHEKVKKKENK